MTWIWVFVGGGLGSLLRYGVGVVLPTQPWHWGVLAVNAAGSGLAGYFLAQPSLSEGVRLSVIVGLLGGFTTFSAFSVEVTRLISEQQILLAGIYVLTNVTISLLACYIIFRLCAV